MLHNKDIAIISPAYIINIGLKQILTDYFSPEISRYIPIPNISYQNLRRNMIYTSHFRIHFCSIMIFFFRVKEKPFC